MIENQNISKEKVPQIRKEKEFLINLRNNYKTELKKIHAYLANLNYNLRIVNKLINEVK